MAAHRQLIVSIGEASVAVETQDVKAQYAWGYVAELEETPDVIWLSMPRSNALPVPARVFRDAEDRAAFLALARARIAASRA